MEHYICTGGCKGVSPKPGTCQAPDCPNHNEPLERCNCEDNLHYGAFENSDKEFDEEEK